MNPHDLITQVRQPGDKGTKSAGTDEQNDKAQSSAKPKLNLPVPTPAANDQEAKNFPKREAINSPREMQEGRTAPWRDDHLLPPQSEHKKGAKCLVLDLDETLVHSSFKPVDCDFIIPVEIEGIVHKVYVSKRPHVDEFMKRCGELFEVVVFTASLAKYADPVLDLLDVHKVVDWRLFRESCSPFKGSYVKDMGRMGRELSQILIIDNSPHSYAFNPENAIPVETWFTDPNDSELLDLLPPLTELSKCTDVLQKLRELNISGLEALKRELAQAGVEYSDSESVSDEIESETEDGEAVAGSTAQDNGGESSL